MLFRILLLILTIIIGGGVILFTIIKFLISINQGKSRLYREINKIRANSKNLSSDLVPIDEGELKFLSYNQQKNSKFNASKGTILTSIYNEPFIVFYPKYIKGNKKAVLVAYTSDKEFSYIINEGVIDIFVDENPFARVSEDGKIRDLNNRVIGYIEKNSSGIKKIFINQKEMAAIKPSDKNSITEKPFLSLATTSKEEEDILLAISLPELVLAK